MQILYDTAVQPTLEFTGGLIALGSGGQGGNAFAAGDALGGYGAQGGDGGDALLAIGDGTTLTVVVDFVREQLGLLIGGSGGSGGDADARYYDSCHAPAATSTSAAPVPPVCLDGNYAASLACATIYETLIAVRTASDEANSIASAHPSLGLVEDLLGIAARTDPLDGTIATPARSGIGGGGLGVPINPPPLGPNPLFGENGGDSTVDNPGPASGGGEGNGGNHGDAGGFSWGISFPLGVSGSCESHTHAEDGQSASEMPQPTNGGNSWATGGPGGGAIIRGGNGGNATLVAANGGNGANGGRGGNGAHYYLAAPPFCHNLALPGDGGHGGNGADSGPGVATGGAGGSGINGVNALIGGNGGNAYSTHGRPGAGGAGGNPGLVKWTHTHGDNPENCAYHIQVAHDRPDHGHDVYWCESAENPGVTRYEYKIMGYGGCGAFRGGLGGVSSEAGASGDGLLLDGNSGEEVGPAPPKDMPPERAPHGGGESGNCGDSEGSVAAVREPTAPDEISFRVPERNDDEIANNYPGPPEIVAVRTPEIPPE